MRIGLVDVDGHGFPNLALMKLSAWHKAQGDRVEFADTMFPTARYTTCQASTEQDASFVVSAPNLTVAGSEYSTSAIRSSIAWR